MRAGDVISWAGVQVAPQIRDFEYRVIKRAIDLLGAVAILVALSPLFLAAALAVALTSPGPVFYRWHVVGRGGAKFVGYKFRTMVANAEELKAQLWHLNERNGPTFKLRNDPRVTPVGRILRKFSLDELPQLLSVIKGDMSLVGPRPVGIREWEQFESWQRRKLSVTPGGICLWHVRGKPDGHDTWVRLDLEYIDNWSLWLDLTILVGGVLYVLRGRNY